MKILLFLLLIFLPFQFGKHFWPSFSYVLGLKIDYLSPVVYLQDLIVFLIFFFYFKNKFKTKKLLKPANIALSAIFLLIIAANIYFSLNRFISAIQWLRLIEFFLLGLIISKNKTLVWKDLTGVIPFWLIGEFALGVWQVLKQSTIGGIFRLLGERTFSVISPGIARADWMGRIFLRPYGTFSHPNSLAGFILVCLILSVGTLKKSNFKKVSIVCGFLLLILCFSRTVWLALFLINLFYILWQIYLFFKKRKQPTFYYYLTLFSTLIMVFLFSRTRFEPASFGNRQLLFVQGVKTVQKNPIFGVGLNNFIPNLSLSENSWQFISFLQPVHNIFLLTASETGLTGLIVFTGFLAVTIRRSFQFLISNFKFQIILAMLAILFTGLFDHYWLTLIQNQLLFTLVLGLMWGK